MTTNQLETATDTMHYSPCSANVPKFLYHRRRTRILCLRRLRKATVTCCRVAEETPAAVTCTRPPAQMRSFQFYSHQRCMPRANQMLLCISENVPSINHISQNTYLKRHISRANHRRIMLSKEDKESIFGLDYLITLTILCVVCGYALYKSVTINKNNTTSWLLFSIYRIPHHFCKQ